MWHWICCTWQAPNVLHMICTQLHFGHVSVGVGVITWHSEEMIKNIELCLSMSLLLLVTCSHEMIDKSRHAVPRFSLKTVVGVSLGEIEIFALCRSSFIFTPYTCSFLLYSTHKCFKFCQWSTYWSIWHWEMTPKWPIFTEGLLSVTRAEPHVSHTKTKITVSRCELLTWLFEIIK